MRPSVQVSHGRGILLCRRTDWWGRGDSRGGPGRTRDYGQSLRSGAVLCVVVIDLSNTRPDRSTHTFDSSVSGRTGVKVDLVSNEGWIFPSPEVCQFLVYEETPGPSWVRT